MDTISDVETGNYIPEAETDDREDLWIPYIDRQWLKQLWRNEESDLSIVDRPASDSAHYPSLGDYARVGKMLRHDMSVQSIATHVAVILADVPNASWIMKAAPFPVVEVEPVIGELYHVYKDHVRVSNRSEAVNASKSFERDFVGKFTMTGSSERRRHDSPPPSPRMKKRRVKTW
ncbi:hypothetical protein VP1G_02843 [Cytospora mali]|uniref:Uncharacterized protein n=1 Tax=Cytospora mali TaxID=578113 RepID=A0A194UUY4_CYTMA|nr:hypothetical protein VP1G_02843 [Valsa mali var. pyri (nom. inval.)]